MCNRSQMCFCLSSAHLKQGGLLVGRGCIGDVGEVPWVGCHSIATRSHCCGSLVDCCDVSCVITPRSAFYHSQVTCGNIYGTPKGLADELHNAAANADLAGVGKVQLRVRITHPGAGGRPGWSVEWRRACPHRRAQC